MSRIYFGSKTKTIDFIKNEFPNKEIVFCDNAEMQAKNYSPFFDINKIFLHDNPCNEDIKLISEEVHKNRGIHFMFFDDESYDGRNSFVQSIKKQSLIFDFSYPVLGDEQTLKRNIDNYLRANKVSMNPDCFVWLYKNCPIVRIKSKKSGSKKEIICYDTDILFKEIEKLSSIKSLITLEDFENTQFNSDGDIFLFFDNIFSKKVHESFDLCEKLLSTMGDQAMLMILLNQLLFIMSVSACKERNIYKLDEVQSISEMKDLLGQYFTEDWNEASFAVKSQNPIRIKIEMFKESLSTDEISQMIQTIVYYIKDLRNNGNVNIAMFLCLNKLLAV